MRRQTQARKAARNRARATVSGLVLALVLGAPLAGLTGTVQAQVREQGLAGSYLAARAAVVTGDHRVAAVYFENALAADPGNPMLIGNAIFANAALGQWDRAEVIAGMLDPAAEGQDLVQLVRLVRALAAGDLITARAAIEAGQGAGPLVDPLVLAWVHLGEGDMRRATEVFRAVAAEPGLADIAWTNLALARAAVGDFEGADAILSGDEVGPLSATDHSLRARAEVLVQLDRADAALELLDFFTQSLPDPALLALRERIAERAATPDAPPPYTFLTTWQQGAAEVFHALAQALAGDAAGSGLPLIYARAAHAIDPGNTASVILSGGLLSQGGQYGLAAEAFAQVPPGDPTHIEAQLGRADAYFSDDRQAEAVAVLRALAADYPDLATVHASLGDALRRTDDCPGAVVAYTRALDLVDANQTRNWFLHYARGICHEFMGDFAASEADFRQALVLSPEQPNVLNNLGYSLVEQRRNLDEALDMIERAVAAEPDSGYIVDSLGWVFYRLGRYEEAVDPMERAVALMPNDPIINDHLGDVYWMVGRHREARFQWSRALSFEPEPDEATRIRRKLDVGLDRVLADEAAGDPE